MSTTSLLFSTIVMKSPRERANDANRLTVGHHEGNYKNWKRLNVLIKHHHRWRFWILKIPTFTPSFPLAFNSKNGHFHANLLAVELFSIINDLDSPAKAATITTTTRGTSCQRLSHSFSTATESPILFITFLNSTIQETPPQWETKACQRKYF